MSEIETDHDGKSQGSHQPGDSDGQSAENAAIPKRVGHRFGPGNTYAMKHGAYRSLDQPEMLAAIAGKRDELTRDLGGELSVIQSDLVTDYARVDVLIESVAANIEVGGVLSAQGRVRAAVKLLLVLLDRRLRIATTLGIERKAKPVVPLAEVLRGD